MNNDPVCWTLKRAAAELNLSINHLRQLANAGQVPCFRDSRNSRCFLPPDIEAFRLERERTKAAREKAKIGKRLAKPMVATTLRKTVTKLNLTNR